METARELIAVRNITQEDGRLVFTTPKSVGFVAILAILTVVGVVLWLLLNAPNDPGFQRMSNLQKAGTVIFFVVVLVSIVGVCWKTFPAFARVARQGDVIVFDRERDALLRKDDCLAPLSSLKTVRINAYTGTRTTRRGQEPWTVSLLAQDGAEVLELGAAHEAAARTLARTIADYIGAPISHARRLGNPAS